MLSRTPPHLSLLRARAASGNTALPPSPRPPPTTGGEVSGFKAIAPGKRITFTVSLPDGSCVATVSAFRQGGRTDGPVNICDKGGYILDVGESGPKFQPLSQVMLVR